MLEDIHKLGISYLKPYTLHQTWYIEATYRSMDSDDIDHVDKYGMVEFSKAKEAVKFIKMIKKDIREKLIKGFGPVTVFKEGYYNEFIYEFYQDEEDLHLATLSLTPLPILNMSNYDV